MCGNYHQYHSPCGHSGIVGVNLCKGFGTTCLGPDPSKGMDITLPPVDSLCNGCHATAHQPNPEARLDENDPYRKEARERAAALEKQARDFRAEQEEKLKRKAKEEELAAEVKRQEMKRKAANDADPTVFPAKRKATGKTLREEREGNEGKKRQVEEMKGKNKEVETEAEEEDNEDDDDASDIYNA